MKIFNIGLYPLPKGSGFTPSFDKIRKEVCKSNDYKCSICNGKGKKHPVEAHERWEYNKYTKTQIMIDIIPLCPMCHLTTHFGLAQIKRKDKAAFNHLLKINKITPKEAEKHIEESWKQWTEISKIKWEVNVDYLVENYNKYLTKETIEKIQLLRSASIIF